MSKLSRGRRSAPWMLPLGKPVCSGGEFVAGGSRTCGDQMHVEGSVFLTRGFRDRRSSFLERRDQGSLVCSGRQIWAKSVPL
jgi:hypothetical protein